MKKIVTFKSILIWLLWMFATFAGGYMVTLICAVGFGETPDSIWLLIGLIVTFAGFGYMVAKSSKPNDDFEDGYIYACLLVITGLALIIVTVVEQDSMSQLWSEIFTMWWKSMVVIAVSGVIYVLVNPSWNQEDTRDEHVPKTHITTVLFMLTGMAGLVWVDQPYPIPGIWLTNMAYILALIGVQRAMLLRRWPVEPRVQAIIAGTMVFFACLFWLFFMSMRLA